MPSLTGMAVGAGVAIGAASIAVPLVGFTAGGVGAGTLAATVQGLIGNVGAGSFFASLQSAGVVGMAGATIAKIGAAGAAIGGYFS